MKVKDTIHSANARSRRVPTVILKLLLAFVLSAVVLAVMVPALAVRGIALTHWMIWPVIIASMALCLGGEIRAGLNRRD
jgi:hypothetical protein